MWRKRWWPRGALGRLVMAEATSRAAAGARRCAAAGPQLARKPARGGVGLLVAPGACGVRGSERRSTVAAGTTATAEGGFGHGEERRYGTEASKRGEGRRSGAHRGSVG